MDATNNSKSSQWRHGTPDAFVPGREARTAAGERDIVRCPPEPTTGKVWLGERLGWHHTSTLKIRPVTV